MTRTPLRSATARLCQVCNRAGQRPKSDRLAPKVLNAIADGRSYRWIVRDLGISKNTVTDIVKRHRPSGKTQTSQPGKLISANLLSVGFRPLPDSTS